MHLRFESAQLEHGGPLPVHLTFFLWHSWQLSSPPPSLMVEEDIDEAQEMFTHAIIRF